MDVLVLFGVLFCSISGGFVFVFVFVFLLCFSFVSQLDYASPLFQESFEHFLSIKKNPFHRRRMTMSLNEREKESKSEEIIET